MIVYLTYNDQPSGVYWSQVTDVVAHLNGLGGPKVRLVAFVSTRGFWQVRRSIKQRSPSAWVLPMVPKLRFWRWNLVLLCMACMMLRPSGIIARGVFATWMACRMRTWGLTRKVCFDGRGGYAAEWEEYRLIDDDALIAQFRPLEHAAIHQADIRLAVSRALVRHWEERYGWKGDAFVVVPCTLGADHRVVERNSTDVSTGTPTDESSVLLIYSGSTAGWQSFALLKDLLIPLLETQAQVKVLFLSKPDANNQALQQRFPGRVDVKWARPDEVAALLAHGDHGLLVREDTITNRVASPTKFAEYLAAGLPILISDHLGDFSAMVREHGLGEVVHKGSRLPTLGRTDPHKAHRLQRFAAERLTKVAFNVEYRRLLEVLR